MNKLLLAGAASLALSMGAAAAHAQSITTGFIGASYSDIDLGGSGANLYDLSGTVAFDVSDDVEVQLDGHAGSLDPNGAGSSSETLWGPTGHLFFDKGNYKAGVFLGYEDFGDTFGSGTTLTGYGVEGRLAASDNLSVGALAGWATVNIDGSPDLDLTTYKLDASLFSSDHLRWDLSAAHTRFEWGPFNGNATTWALGGEYQLEDKPISFTFGIANTASDLAAGDNRTLSVGVRYTIGGSLKDRDRTSSPFAGLPFAFGGIGGLLAGQASVLQDFYNCFNEEGSCPNEDAINEWVDGFDDFDCFFDECDQ